MPVKSVSSTKNNTLPLFIVLGLLIVGGIIVVISMSGGNSKLKSSTSVESANGNSNNPNANKSAKNDWRKDYDPSRFDDDAALQSDGGMKIYEAKADAPIDADLYLIDGKYVDVRTVNSTYRSRITKHGKKVTR